MKLKVLIIDDEKTIRKTFKLRLTKWGYDVYLASNGETGLKMLDEIDIRVVITDLHMPGLNGSEVIKKINNTYPDIDVIAVTGYSSIETAVKVMKNGAFDFLSKPLDFSQVKSILHKIYERISLKYENQSLRDSIGDLKTQLEKRYRYENLVGKCKSMQEVFSLIEKVAPTEATTVIYGATGTGKELVARAIHYNSNRKSEKLVTVDCGTLSDTLLESELFGHKKGAFTGANASKRGRFEQADGGSIFLDEIGNASKNVQKKLLRVIQEKKLQRLGDEKVICVDVRIIAATNENLLQLVKEGNFRRDLYYRLNVVPIYLPLLKERKDDIPLLVRHFADKYANLLGLEPLEISLKAINDLMNYHWPGNVRELSNIIERAVIMMPGNTINDFHISEFYEDEPEKTGMHNVDITSPQLDPPLSEQINILEQNYLRFALQRYKGKINKVAERSGLNLRTLFRKLKKYDLDKNEFR